MGGGSVQIEKHCSGYKEIRELSPVQLFATPWTVAHQAPLSMGFSRQEYWSGVPFPTPGDLPDLSRHQTHASCVSYIGRQILDLCGTWEAFTEGVKMIQSLS